MLGAGVGLGGAGALLPGTASALGVDEIVEINIKPGSAQNVINCNKNGATSVAVLTTDEFDATDVDPSSLRFGNPLAVVSGGGAELARPGGRFKDVQADRGRSDGDTDFLGHFATKDAGFTAGDTEGWLIGETTDGRVILGRDSVRLVGKCPEPGDGLPEVGLGTTAEQHSDDVPSPGAVTRPPIEPPEGRPDGWKDWKDRANDGNVPQPPLETIQLTAPGDTPSPPEGSGGDLQSTDGGAAASLGTNAVSTQAVGQHIETGEGFEAWENSELSATPPDANLAVGPSKVLAAVNLRWGIYDKFSGSRQFQVRLADWFDPVLGETETFVFDPKALYDHHSGRFVLAAVARDSEEQQGSWVVAVSDDSNPFGLWWLTRIPHGVEGEWPDYPGLGVDESGIYLTANIFAFGGGFRRAKLVTIDKTPLYNGNSFTYWWFGDVRRHDGNRAFTIQPTHDTPSTSTDSTQWLVSSHWNSGSKLTLYELRNPVTSPRLYRYGIDAPAYSLPPDAEQPGTSATLDTVDARLMNAVYENGSVWTAHSINYDWGGDGDPEALLRWYEIDTGNKSLSQRRGWGRPNGDYFFPTVASDGDSTMITYNEAGNVDPRIEVAGRTADHTQNSLESAAVIKYGESVAPGGRWGDYSGIVVNPSAEGETYYAIGEYANDEETTNEWATWVGSASFEDDDIVIE